MEIQQKLLIYNKRSFTKLTYNMVMNLQMENVAFIRNSGTLDEPILEIIESAHEFNGVFNEISNIRLVINDKKVPLCTTFDIIDAIIFGLNNYFNELYVPTYFVQEGSKYSNKLFLPRSLVSAFFALINDKDPINHYMQAALETNLMIQHMHETCYFQNQILTVTDAVFFHNLIANALMTDRECLPSNPSLELKHSKIIGNDDLIHLRSNPRNSKLNQLYAFNKELMTWKKAK